MQLPTTHLGVPVAAATKVVPGLGEHSLEVARELGLDQTLVERAAANGALVQGKPATYAAGHDPS